MDLKNNINNILLYNIDKSNGVYVDHKLETFTDNPDNIEHYSNYYRRTNQRLRREGRKRNSLITTAQNKDYKRIDKEVNQLKINFDALNNAYDSDTRMINSTNNQKSDVILEKQLKESIMMILY